MKSTPLSRERGHDFQGAITQGASIAENGLTLAATTSAPDHRRHGFMSWRRCVDGVWQHHITEDGYQDAGLAMPALRTNVENDAPALSMPSGIAKRPKLFDFGEGTLPEIFKYLMNAAHMPAAWVLNQVYLALPRPDPNWASDARSGNFHTRLWEAYLVASFREQGMLVQQPQEAPDFRVQTPHGKWPGSRR